MLHTAGFPNAVMPEIDGADPRRCGARRSPKWELEWEPGTRFEYHATSAHWVLADSSSGSAASTSATSSSSACARPLGLAAPARHPRRRAGRHRAARRGRRRPRGDELDHARSTQPEVRAAGVPGGGGDHARGRSRALLPGGAARTPAGSGTPTCSHDAKTNVRCVFPDNLLQVPVNRTLGLVLAGDDGQHFMRYGSFGVAQLAALDRPRGRAHAGRLGRPRDRDLVRVLHQRHRQRRR